MAPFMNREQQEPLGGGVEQHTEILSSALRTPQLSEALLAEGSRKLLEAFKASEGQRYTQVSHELSYGDYLREVLKSPRHLIRNTFQYTADAMESFGAETKTVLGQELLDFKLRTWPWESGMVCDKRKLEGQEPALNEFYQQMRLFGRREFSNRMFIFHGPPGSGKTRLNDTLDAMLEHYSERDPNGALYRLIWVFPEERAAKAFGFSMNQPRSAYATEEGSGQVARIVYRPIGNTDPLFLLSASCDGKGPREQLLANLEEQGRLSTDLNVDYLLRGELDTFSESLLETLVSFYRQDYIARGLNQQDRSESTILDEVLNRHVRVERYTLSCRQGRGLCSIWGSANRDADIEQFYDSYAPPPEEVRAAERDLHIPTSFMLRANRGHLHFSDLFRPNERDRGGDDISHMNHLLNEIESGHTQIFSLRQAAAIKTEKVNVLLRADANDDLIMMKSGANGWDSLVRRLQFITVPHITRYLSEAAAQRDFFRTIVGTDRVICPHVLDAVALFVTASRLLKPNPTSYSDVHERMPGILARMSVVEKALLLQEPRDGVKNELNMLKSEESAKWHQDDLVLLKKFLPKIADEYMYGVGETRFSLYDGGFGVSTANAQDLLRKMAVFRQGEPITVIEVIEVLKQHQDKFPYYEKIEESKRQYARRLLDDKKQEASRLGRTMNYKETQEALKEILSRVEKEFPIPSPDSIVKEIVSYAKRMVQDDFYAAMGIASEEQSKLSIRRYLAHARVSIGQAPLEVEQQYRVNDRERGHNEELLQDFEDKVVKNENLSTPEKRQEYRKHLFEQIGNWQAENPQESVVTNYENIFGELVEGMRVVRKEMLEKPLHEFEQMTREYADDPLKVRKDLDGKEDERRRAQRWVKAIKALEDTLKYPREERWETIRKHLEWAVKK